MSRYDYAVSYGKPVAVSYDVGPGTRAYVTRVEERVQQVRRPSAIGYAYYSTMKTEKDGRPREVDNFITKILDEVNGPTVSATTWSSEPVKDLFGLPSKVNPTKDYGAGYKFGDDSPTKGDGRRGYYVEYTYAGSRNYGDPYAQQNDYGLPNQSGNSRLKSEIPKDYQAPKNRWETSPYNPPRVEYHSSKGYSEEPESPRDYGLPNNQLKSEMAKDYGIPNNQWNTSSVKPVSSKPYEGSADQWNRPLKPISVRQPPNNRSLDSQGDYSPVKPYSSDGYGIDNEKGSSASPRYDSPTNNRWGNSPSKAIYQARPYEDDNIGDRDRYLGNSSLKPQSPKNYGVSDNPNYRGRSPSPEYEHPPRNNLLGGVGSDNWGNSPLKAQSPRGYGTHDNQWDRPSSPVANKGDGTTPRGRELKLESPRGYEVPNDQKERSVSPGYEHPPRNGITGGIPNNRWSNSPLKTQSPSDYGTRDNQWDKPSSPVARKNDSTPDDRQVKLGSPNDQKGRSASPGYEHPPRNEIISRAPSNHWDNAPVRPQSPRDTPSSPVYNAYNEQKNVQPNVAIRDGVPASGNRPNVTNNAYDPEPKGDYGGGNSTMKPSSGYQPSPLSQATSSPLGRVNDKTRDSSGQQSVSGGASSQPKYFSSGIPSRYDATGSRR